MSSYMEAVMTGEAEMMDDIKRDDFIRKSVTAALDVLDEAYPEFKKSSGPFGDRLAVDLHRRIEQAFNELRDEEGKELTSLKRLQNKYRSQ